MKSSPPRKGGAQREKEGERVAYLSILVSFLGGRAHGSSLAALLRWGRGKCTVILEALNQKRERNYGNPARMSALSMPLSRVLGLTSGSLFIDVKAFPTIPAASAQSLTSTPLHGNEHSWATGSFQKPFEIWAGAQNPRVEIFLPPLSTAHGLQH